ncbi:TRAP transporter small permease [Devosia sp. J2-20]|jgi:TRAP-type C4-dicarboxylate transport system permease small subunit|uniref:TRAP transporter small permease protein n=1 Tax=Devosia litorisediminis TaxID=2829817 RepID=A0A942EGT1_9HYPH|nr:MULTISPECIES: TRAP transporter small permease [Devosia]MBS3849646.1 TRAP transporter small permease [Devosia litorisediminis]MCZ4347928.1 TRAP transporter small permease [Devosia neptuniae]WDR00406.1 TRAP transporter small permease [Devosia sp. J2-20]|tara:strand:- start:13327 stop:13830 length:504 start_codon:yes stop_codon:yes gene_type:complete
MSTKTDHRVRTGLLWLKRGADTVGVLLFLTAFTGFIVQIFFRYVLNQPLAWTEEATMIAFIWTVFWAAAFMVPVREHVTFDVVYDIAPEHVRRFFSICTMALVVVAFLILVPYTLDYLQFLMRKKSDVLRIPKTWIYGCYLLFIVAFATQGAFRIYNLLRPNWRDQI